MGFYFALMFATEFFGKATAVVADKGPFVVMAVEVYY
jgi:hypothetical protein